MHYIIGTRFTVDLPRPGVIQARSTRGLPQGLVYQLIHINITKENTRDYIFVGSDNNKYTLNFPTCKDADTFIAKHRREIIPNYEIKETVDIMETS